MECGPEMAVYIDDVAIQSDTWEEHLRRVENALERIKKAGLIPGPYGGRRKSATGSGED